MAFDFARFLQSIYEPRPTPWTIGDVLGAIMMQAAAANELAYRRAFEEQERRRSQYLQAWQALYSQAQSIEDPEQRAKALQELSPLASVIFGESQGPSISQQAPILARLFRIGGPTQQAPQAPDVAQLYKRISELSTPRPTELKPVSSIPEFQSFLKSQPEGIQQTMGSQVVEVYQGTTTPTRSGRQVFYQAYNELVGKARTTPVERMVPLQEVDSDTAQRIKSLADQARALGDAESAAAITALLGQRVVVREDPLSGSKVYDASGILRDALNIFSQARADARAKAQSVGQFVLNALASGQIDEKKASQFINSIPDPTMRDLARKFADSLVPNARFEVTIDGRRVVVGLGDYLSIRSQYRENIARAAASGAMDRARQLMSDAVQNGILSEADARAALSEGEFAYRRELRSMRAEDRNLALREAEFKLREQETRLRAQEIATRRSMERLLGSALQKLERGEQLTPQERTALFLALPGDVALSLITGSLPRNSASFVGNAVKNVSQSSGDLFHALTVLRAFPDALGAIAQAKDQNELYKAIGSLIERSTNAAEKKALQSLLESRDVLVQAIQELNRAADVVWENSPSDVARRKNLKDVVSLIIGIDGRILSDPIASRLYPVFEARFGNVNVDQDPVTTMRIYVRSLMNGSLLRYFGGEDQTLQFLGFDPKSKTFQPGSPAETIYLALRRWRSMRTSERR